MAKPVQKVRLVIDKAGDTKPRLVRSINESRALAHVARATFDVRNPTQDELIALARDGVEVEETTAGDQE